MIIESIQPTPIIDLGEYQGHHLWIKREDLIPFSFGGNKARKAKLFFKDIDDGSFDCVVTYGSSSSNHCRVVANECCRREMSCFIISPDEESRSSFNHQMMELFGAEIITTPITAVHNTIENTMAKLKNAGRRPYFIEGGGHGNLGTEAYIQCYQEIIEQEAELGIHFDYIFLASGTGTTQAGLVCGHLLNKDKRTIIGISIARKNPRGRDIVIESIRSYLGKRVAEDEIQSATVYIDRYALGYGRSNAIIVETIIRVFRSFGIPLDATYTGKAFTGMIDYLKEVKKSNVLFIHTGGEPLFFDFLDRSLHENKKNL